MKKLSILPIALVLAVGAVWANSLFPNTDEFPAFPTGAGTIGGALTSWFDITTGTANNTVLLDGRSASGYLQNTSCTTPGDVWKGIDAAGKAVCGPRGALLAFAKILEGTMQVNGTSKSAPTILYEGDRIDTNVSQTGTIQFTDDISIARLSTSTSILLERGNTDGTIAQVVLDQGLLWGRVLTSTGINIGGGGLIAGVRGTSVSVKKEGALYHLSIPHSTSTTAAATVTCGGGTTRTMIPGSILNSGGCDTLTQFSLPQLYTDTWIAENTRKDIIYLDSFISSSRAIAEVNVTDPDSVYGINTPEFFEAKRALCNNTNIWDTSSNSCIYAYANYTVGNDPRLLTGNATIDPTLKITTTTLKLQDDGWVWGYNCRNGTSFASTTPAKVAAKATNLNISHSIHDLLQLPVLNDRTPAGVYKFGNLRNTLMLLQTQGTNNIRVINPTGSCQDLNEDEITYTIEKEVPTFNNTVTVPTPTTSGLLIETTGQYISYATGSLGNLAGKTITIELASTPNPSESYGVLVSHGNTFQIYYIPASNSWQCSLGGVSCSVNESGRNISYTIPSTGVSIERFMIGNNISGENPIGAKIKKIIIK